MFDAHPMPDVCGVAFNCKQTPTTLPVSESVLGAVVHPITYKIPHFHIPPELQVLVQGQLYNFPGFYPQKKFSGPVQDLDGFCSRARRGFQDQDIPERGKRGVPAPNKQE